jgi:hypothetical protein
LTGSYTVYDTETFTQAITAINAGTTVSGSYVVVLSSSFASSDVTFLSNAVKTITIRGDTLNRTLSNNSSGALFTIPTGITLVLDNNATLNGNSKGYSVVSVLPGGELIMKQGSLVSDAKASGIRIEGGAFTMQGGTISGNAASVLSYSSGYYYSASGGGVYVAANGTFTMSGGTISGNTASVSVSSSSYYDDSQCYGGGVYVAVNGSFTMLGGTISGNVASTVSSSYYSYSTSSYGGGVYSSGVFTMSGGAISGNTASAVARYGSYFSGGGGVYSSGTFIKQGGGTIDAANSAANGKVAYVSGKIRNTTAGPGINLDSRVTGSAGGWE